MRCGVWTCLIAGAGGSRAAIRAARALLRSAAWRSQAGPGAADAARLHSAPAARHLRGSHLDYRIRYHFLPYLARAAEGYLLLPDW